MISTTPDTAIPLEIPCASEALPSTNSRAGRILIVEDQSIVAHHLAEVLQRHGYEVCGIAATGAKAVALAAAKSPDLVLMDINLRGELDGIDVASQLILCGRIGVVFLSAYSEDETLRRATASGAHGYLVKPVTEPTLLATVGVALARVAMDRKGLVAIRALESALANAENASLTDALTGVYNRHGMETQISRELDRARRHRQTVALILIDIDNFKNINDEFGHQQGDLAIKATARRIQEAVRPTDIVARYGGDEFIVFAADDCSVTGARTLGERIRRRVERSPGADSTEANTLTVSIGIATVNVRVGTEVRIEALIHAADQALYAAKAAGRNRVEIGELRPGASADAAA